MLSYTENELYWVRTAEELVRSFHPAAGGVAEYGASRQRPRWPQPFHCGDRSMEARVPVHARQGYRATRNRSGGSGDYAEAGCGKVSSTRVAVQPPRASCGRTVRYKRQTRGRMRYTRKVGRTSRQDRIQGGVILRLLKNLRRVLCCAQARRSGRGRQLMQEASGVREGASVLMHIHTYSSAPDLREDRSAPGDGGSPAGASRHLRQRLTRS